MAFIGRVQDLEYLETFYEADGPQLVAVYGPRHIGVSEMLKRFSYGKKCVYYAAQEQVAQRQARDFAKRFNSQIDNVETWKDALAQCIGQYDGEQKLVVLIDGLGAVVASDPSFLDGLADLLTVQLSQADVLIVLAGHSIELFERHVLAEDGPLGGLVGGSVRLGPLSHWESESFFPKYEAADKALMHAVLNGSPHYLAMVDPSVDASENIKRLVLERGCLLENETELILHQDFREVATYNAILEALASDATQFSGLSEQTGVEKRKLSVYVKNLVDAGLVERVSPVRKPDASGKRQGDAARNSRSEYRLASTFLRFWYANVVPSKSDLSFGDIENVYRTSIVPRMNAYLKDPLTTMVKAWIERANALGLLSKEVGEVGPAWKTDANVDLVGYSEDGSYAVAAIVQVQDGKTGSADIPSVDEVRDALQVETVSLFVFAMDGFTGELKAHVEDTGELTLLTVDDLYAEAKEPTVVVRERRPAPAAKPKKALPFVVEDDQPRNIRGYYAERR
ncbi:AAA family ATPase [Slackia heliotrinireducens]|uniref:AAA family ATPase n=1 Tax=Slackia heliotrinireducens TaxID=84110 RepID=UPI003315981A